MNESTTESETLEVSKSQRNRDANELLDLAKDLITMQESRLKKIPMDQDLRDEVDFARSIRSRGARKRQLMTVGKILRKRDNDELLDAVNNADQKTRQENARFHQIEAWRNRLIEGSDQDLSELLEHSPTANAQTLRQLIRNAKKEAKLGKPPTAARKLFKILRETNEENPLPPHSTN
jgi:ribosome-associated protein